MANNDSPFSLGNTIKFISDNFGLIFLMIISLIGGFFIGSLWTEKQMIATGGNNPKVVAEQPSVDPSQPTADYSIMPEISDLDHVRGSQNPQIYLVEYSDYECPFCQSFHSTMQQVLDEYGDQIAWVYRHYPLSFHPNAQPAAEASECIADLSGNEAFWKFSDEIFAQNEKLGGKLSPEAVQAAIAASGADVATINDCVDSGEMTERVQTMMDGGSSAGVSGTPGTILMTADGEYDFIGGALPYAQVQLLLDKYL